jgi:hypothetical protein
MAEKLTEKDPDPADDIVIVEDDPKPATDARRAEDDEDDEDDAPARRAADSDADDSADPDARDALRERRRQEKLERKQRRDDAIKRDKLELDFLRQRNDDLERRLTAQEQRSAQVDAQSLDAQIAAAQRTAENAERVIAKAVEAGNGNDVAQAMRYRDQALDRVRQLQWSKQQAAQSQQQAPRAAPIDDATMRHAQRFLSENAWYDPQGRDEDSAIVLAVDAALVRDGYDPRSEDYWAELRKRAARRLPERFAKAAPRGAERDSDPDGDEPAAAERRPRGGPAVGSGREHVPATTRREVRISPERKQALIDAGVWDDPVLRAKYVKRYAEYDRQQRSNA